MRAASVAEAEESGTDQASFRIDDFFTEEFNGQFSWQALVQPPQTRTRRSGRARQRFRVMELRREWAMTEEEATKAEEDERRTPARAP